MDKSAIAMALLALVAELSVFAETYAPDALPPPAYADSEVSTNLVFSAGDADRRFLTVEMEVNATSSNALLVAFGVDTNQDGCLSPDETQVRVGWDCGAWFVVDERADWNQRWPKDDAVRSLTYRLRYSQLHGLRSLEIKDGDSSVFSSCDLPGTLFNPAWNCIRVTARGLAIPNERISIRNSRDATILHIR